MGIVLGARLDAIADMLGTFDTVADIGSDHGRLAAALLQTGKAKQVIASDISSLSLEKAHALAATCGLETRIEIRTADGLKGLKENEVDALVIAGMGGTLIAKILSASPKIAQSAKRIVMQPMRGTAELRYYLHHNGFRIVDERIAYEAGRYYQLIAAQFGEPQTIPESFPKGVYKFGWVMVQKRDPLLLPLLNRYKDGHLKKLNKAEAAGTGPEASVKELNELEALISLMEENA